MQHLSPIICIYFSAIERMSQLFEPTPRQQATIEFTNAAKKRGSTVLMACGDHYQGHMQFSEGWHFVNGQLVETSHSFIASVVYCIGPGAGVIPPVETSDLIVNSPALDAIGRDKLKQYEILSDLIAPTYPINRANWQDIVAKLTTDQIVLKPVSDSGGNGVIVINRNKITDSDIPDTKPYLAQEFVETEAGIPGIMTGRHDLRLIVINGKVKHSFVRIAKPGLMTANTAQGASIKELSLEEIPNEAIKLAKIVDTRLAHFGPRLYSVDFMFGKDHAHVTEINTRPGFPDLESPAYKKVYFDDLLDLLLGAIKN